MSQTETVAKPLPAVPFLKIPDDGGALTWKAPDARRAARLLLGQRMVTRRLWRARQDEARCGWHGDQQASTTTPSSIRNFPGGAGAVHLGHRRSRRRRHAQGQPDRLPRPAPRRSKYDMPVKVVFKDAGRKDKDGASYLAYFFAPRQLNRPLGANSHDRCLCRRHRHDQIRAGSPTGLCRNSAPRPRSWRWMTPRSTPSRTCRRSIAGNLGRGREPWSASAVAKGRRSARPASRWSTAPTPAPPAPRPSARGWAA